jgi:hypothetical protein
MKLLLLAVMLVSIAGDLRAATKRSADGYGVGKTQKEITKILTRLDADEEEAKRKLFLITKAREANLSQLRTLMPQPHQVAIRPAVAKDKKAKPAPEIDSELATYLEKRREQLRQFEEGLETLRKYERYLDERKKHIQ